MNFPTIYFIWIGTILCSSLAVPQSETVKNEQIMYKLWKTLCNSVESGNLSVAQDMITAGADVNREDGIGWTPLLKAVWARKEKLVDLLIRNGANVNHELRSGQGFSPLYIAADSGSKEILEMLLSNGADVNKTIKSTGWTALDIASMNGHEEVVQKLLMYNADVNLATQEGLSALDLALKNGHTKIAELLKAEEKKTETANYTNPVQNNTILLALHVAAKNGNLTNVKRLIKNGSDVNLQDPHGWCPIQYAVWNGRQEVVLYLLKKGAQMNCSFSSGWTLLYIAAELGYTEIAKLLIISGADVNQPMNKTGWTPLHIAADNGHIDMVILLIKNGADISQLTPERFTALQLAEEKEHDGVVKLLRAAAEEKKVSGSALRYLNIIGIAILVCCSFILGYLLFEKFRKSELAYRYACW